VDLFDRFLKERMYLKGVSPETLRYYQCVRRAFEPILANPTRDGMMDSIDRLRKSGVSATSVNTYLRGLKAYCRWLHQEHGYELVKVQFLKTEEKILATLSQEQIQGVIRAKPKGVNETRAHVLSLLLLDTGLRISEATGLTWPDIDFDNLILKVRGKGGKHRLVPISFEGRKVLFKWKQKQKYDKVFATRNGTLPTQRNIQRDMKVFFYRIGIAGVRCSPHTLRHSFAVGYLRNGGNIFYLSKVLGHTSVKTTERYLQSLGIEDLQKVHNRLSSLSR
jgi:integrase/recombinase XerD